MTVSNEIQAAMIPIVAGLIVFSFKQYTKFDRVAESLSAIKAALETHTETTRTQETRITVLESTVRDLHELTMAVQALTTNSAKLDTLLEATIKRTDMLEELLYKIYDTSKEFKCPHSN